MAALPFRFVHCADLHLDSPFGGISEASPEIANRLREATFRSFERIVDLAIRQRAAFLIIAGDVYDAADRSLRAQWRFREILERAAEAGVECFVAHGNHDPLDGWEAELRFPPEVHRFGGDNVERYVVRTDGSELATVYGISYPTREVRENLAVRFSADPDDPFPIGVLHGNLDGDPSHDNYAPCTLADLEESGIRYWALGHIHTRRVVRVGNPYVVYPGNIQGRNPREPGERGCYVVSVDRHGNARVQFEVTDDVRWAVEEVSIGDIRSLDELVDVLQERRGEIRSSSDGRGVVLRILLTGRGDLHGIVSSEEHRQSLLETLREGEENRSDFVWTESIRIQTRPSINLDQRRQMSDFVGEFLRASARLRSEEALRDVVRRRLSTYPNYPMIARYLDEWDPAIFAEILDDAEMLGVDRLLQDEE